MPHVDGLRSLAFAARFFVRRFALTSGLFDAFLVVFSHVDRRRMNAQWPWLIFGYAGCEVET